MKKYLKNSKTLKTENADCLSKTSRDNNYKSYIIKLALTFIKF